MHTCGKRMHASTRFELRNQGPLYLCLCLPGRTTCSNLNTPNLVLCLGWNLACLPAHPWRSLLKPPFILRRRPCVRTLINHADQVFQHDVHDSASAVHTCLRKVRGLGSTLASKWLGHVWRFGDLSRPHHHYYVLDHSIAIVISWPELLGIGCLLEPFGSLGKSLFEDIHTAQHRGSTPIRQNNQDRQQKRVCLQGFVPRGRREPLPVLSGCFFLLMLEKFWP